MPPHKRAGASARKVARRRTPRIKMPPPREADPSAKKTGRRRTYYTAEFLAEARRHVEQTPESTTSIAGTFGMHQSVLARLIEREGWIRPESSGRRRGLSPVMRLAAQADALVSAAPTSPSTPTPTLPLSGGGSPTASVAPDTSTIDRLEQAVLKELATVETMRASLGSEPLRPMDAERTARTLSTLTETLAKLRRLRLAAQPQTGSPDDDDIPDIDAFRRDLARRIDAFVASRAGEGRADGDRSVAVEQAPS
jgi:hypothetical protein